MSQDVKSKSMTELRYVELTKGMVTPKFVADINHLLLQLSSSALPCTNEWLNHMLDSGTRIFVAIDGDTIVGAVLLVSMTILVGQKDWMEDVVVDEKYRRRGIANQLMDMAEGASRARGAKSINLTSKPDRDAARQMYTARGYQLREAGVFRITF